MAASPSGTRQYFERLKSKGIPALSSRLGRTQLQVSKIGFGGYRVHEFDPDHREALRSALLSGCNLVDTSSNYTDGSSERLIGEVTSELIEAGQLRREEIVIVTKMGYLQGENLKAAKRRAEEQQPFPETTEVQTNLWHNISPEYLDYQISKSIERLKTPILDVVLLHNPEYHLKAGANREAFYQKLEKAFRHLESEVARGRILYYGVSSNTFPEPESRWDFSSLAKMLEITEKISPKHHFAVVQMPFNLFESGAITNKNNRNETVLDFAAQAQLGVLTNRPFNAFQNGRLVRLTHFPTHDQVEIKGHLHTTLGRAIELEKQISALNKSAQVQQWAHFLRDRLSELDDILNWREALTQQVYPSLRQTIDRIPVAQQTLGESYERTMQELLNLITYDLENLANQKTQLIVDQIHQLAPELADSNTLSKKMIRLYSGLPQISTVLVGMRKPQYVHDLLTEFKPMPDDRSRETLQRMQRHRS